MAFIVILLLFMGPLDTIPQDAPLPLLNVMYNVTGSKTAATLLITAIVVLFFLALFNILASVSRLIWAFARDNGLPFSSSLAYVSVTAITDHKNSIELMLVARYIRRSNFQSMP